MSIFPIVNDKHFNVIKCRINLLILIFFIVRSRDVSLIKFPFGHANEKKLI